MDILNVDFNGRGKSVAAPYIGYTRVGDWIMDETGTYELLQGQCYRAWETDNCNYIFIPQARNRVGELLLKNTFKY